MGVVFVCVYELDVASDGVGCANFAFAVLTAADLERCRSDGIDEDLFEDAIADGMPVVGVVLAVVGSDGDSMAMDRFCGGRLSVCDDCVVCRVFACGDGRLRAVDVNDVGIFSFVIVAFFVASLIIKTKTI